MRYNRTGGDPNSCVGKTYLDHAGTTLYAKSLIESFSKDMTSSLLGNPHSASSSSQYTSRRIDHVRLQVLRLFNADPNHYDLVFVSNATAGAKLVIESLREVSGGFWYGYHKDSHTSFVGVRETAEAGQYCFGSDEEVEDWLEERSAAPKELGSSTVGLFAYPAQSNMNGRRLPLSWTSRLRSSKYGKKVYSLLDAAAFVSTSPFDLGDPSAAPDFTVLSFYKMFGFPDLGALIVRKESASILQKRRYFSGGTVDMVVAGIENWYIRKHASLHEQMEDGTLPIHSIIALDHAMKIHKQHFGTFEQISSHTNFLANQLHNNLLNLRHFNDVNVCKIYVESPSFYSNLQAQGPIVAFNLQDSQQQWISITEFEKLTSLRNIEIRSGGLCNPGGIASALSLEPWEMRRNFSAGHRCGGESDIIGGKPTGVIRASLGAMSTLQDINALSDFIQEFFVDKAEMKANSSEAHVNNCKLVVEGLTIYPIKSCGGWSVPHGTFWDVRKEGLLWDREWCLVHRGSGKALSQKLYPRMALLRPRIDLRRGLLYITYHGPTPLSTPNEVSVPLSADPTVFEKPVDGVTPPLARVCGDNVATRVYASMDIGNFFSDILDTPCTLARFPATTSGLRTRLPKQHLNLGSNAPHQANGSATAVRSILLSNESPILAISRSSLNRLNEQIKLKGAKAADASVFRANIVIAEDPATCPGMEQPYVEDEWRSLEIGHQVHFEVLGKCRRCQMITVDQYSGEKNEEPLVTLAQTRRKGGNICFGVHTALMHDMDENRARIRVGDNVVPSRACG